MDTVKRIFTPQSIVIIGVSERPDNLGRNILANLRAFGYQGDLYAVGRRPGQVHGVPIVSTLDEVPDGVDLAVILVPAALVPDLVAVCGRKGIQRLVIESGGFSEFSPAGRKLEEKVIEIARQWDIRFVGPNCISVINLEAGVCLPFASVTPEPVRLGGASVVAQSGGVSITYLDRFSAAGVGVNKVVSIGNKADLDEANYLTYLLDDPGTEMICLYLESIGDGRELMRLARAGDKPIIVHKTNRGQISQRIALSHTAALADDDRIVTGALRQAGMLRAETFRDAVAIGQGLALPPVRGNRLMVISRSGGHAVAAADAAERFGFDLPPLGTALAERVRTLFRADVIALTNPLDLGVIFDFELYAEITEECLRTLEPDAVLLINTYSYNERDVSRRMAQRVERIVKELRRPVALCIYAQGDEARSVQEQVDFPVFTEIDEAVRGLAASRDWHRRKARRASVTPLRSGPAAKAPSESLPAGRLTTDQALALCRRHGVPVADGETVDSVEGAARAADHLGYPVAVKLLSTKVVHKSDSGGVALDLKDAAAVRQSAEEMLSREIDPARVLVQRMVVGGVEVILGGKQDPSFGPVVMFGLGGVYVEVFDDVTFRIAPLSRFDAEEMIDEVRGRQLLDGLRGTPPADREALVEALLAVSRLMTDNPRLVEFDINPLLVLEQGAVAVDARAVVAEK
ncbi:MAG: acetate--CoA ligase family protein [Anaerolineae bacterium]|jgi:acetyltransferase